jgi:uncharacterized protein (DUF952 family)
VILHLAPAADWDGLPPGQSYAAPSLATEGFIHCTGDEETLLRVANSFYRSVPGELVVLDIDERRLAAAVVWEEPVPAPPEGSAVTVFPHVYGPIEQHAVVAVRRLSRQPDGTCTGYEPRS